MKKIFFTVTFLLFTSYIFSQVDLGLPGAAGKGGVANGIAKDWECIGVNPANLGWDNNYRFSISAVILGFSAQSTALDYNQLINAVLHRKKEFSTDDQSTYASIFSNTTGLNLQANSDWLTFSLAIPKIGGIAMNIRDRIFAHVQLNQNAAEMLFLGTGAPIFQDPTAYTKTMGNILDGTNVSYMHYREMNFSYGTKILGIGGTKDSSAISIYAGIGYKYLWGIGNANLSADNGTLTANSAFSSVYDIDYNVNNFTPQTASGLFSSVGNGNAWDFGVGIGIGTKWKITVSATDIGQITWNKNVLTAQDALLDTSKLNFHGVNSWNLPSQAHYLYGDSGIVKVKSGSAYTTTLPSLYRMGFGYQFTRRFLVGADVMVPISSNPMNLQNAYYAAGAQLELAKNFIISFGVAGNSALGLSVPFGITLEHVFKIMEMGLATSDILPYFSHGSNPNISFARSFLRYNLDKKKKTSAPSK